MFCFLLEPLRLKQCQICIYSFSLLCGVREEKFHIIYILYIVLTWNAIDFKMWFKFFIPASRVNRTNVIKILEQFLWLCCWKCKRCRKWFFFVVLVSIFLFFFFIIFAVFRIDSVRWYLWFYVAVVNFDIFMSALSNGLVEASIDIYLDISVKYQIKIQFYVVLLTHFPTTKKKKKCRVRINARLVI